MVTIAFTIDMHLKHLCHYSTTGGVRNKDLLSFYFIFHIMCTHVIKIDLILQILAILAAVTEVIKTQGGTESETEYFGALVSSSDASKTQYQKIGLVPGIVTGKKYFCSQCHPRF